MTVFQCAACRALSVASSVALDGARERAGLSCDACGAVTWLPVGAPSSARVVDVDAPARPAPAPRELPAPAALATRAPTTVATVGSAFTDDQRGRIDERIAKLPPGEGAPGQGELAHAFARLLGQWTSEGEHKAFLKKASMLGELAFAGQRYRQVLDAVPGDPAAKRAQGEILTLAMASMSQQKDLGTVDEQKNGKALAAGLLLIVAIVAAFLVLWKGSDLLRADTGGATMSPDQQQAPPR